MIWVFRCSELDRTLSCNGSMVVTELVDKRQGDEGEEGTDLHAMSADWFMQNAGAASDIPVHCAASDRPHSKWISDFYIRHVQEKVPIDWSMEVEAALSYEFRRFILSGHIDCVALSPDGTEAIGFDLKTGYIPVDIAESNEQIFGYACLLKRAYPTLKKVTFWIVQPRNDEDDGYPRTSSMTLEGDRLENGLPTLEERINAALDNKDELNTGPKQCKWCVGCSCPAIRAEQKLMKMKLTPAVLAEIKRTPDDSTLGDFVVVGRMLAKPLEDATEMLHARLDQLGVVVSGSGATITVKKTKGSIEITAPVPFYQKAKELLQTDERMAVAFKGSKSRIIDQLADAMNIPKGGLAAVTATGIYEGHLAVHTVQGERRILQIS